MFGRPLPAAAATAAVTIAARTARARTAEMRMLLLDGWQEALRPSGRGGFRYGSSTTIAPSTTRTGYVGTGSVAGSERGTPVAGADDRADLLVPVPLAERPVVVGAAVLDRVERAAAVVDADPEAALLDDL